MRPGSLTRRLFDLVVSGGVRWQAMPSPFEVFEYPGSRFEVPIAREAYLDALVHAFPSEEDSLRDYFRGYAKLARQHGLSFDLAELRRAHRLDWSMRARHFSARRAAE